MILTLLISDVTKQTIGENSGKILMPIKGVERHIWSEILGDEIVTPERCATFVIQRLQLLAVCVRSFC